jgi:hypothetical protein
MVRSLVQLILAGALGYGLGAQTPPPLFMPSGTGTWTWWPGVIFSGTPGKVASSGSASLHPAPRWIPRPGPWGMWTVMGTWTWSPAWEASMGRRTSSS